MAKVKKSSELMWMFGTICVALGVAICSKANLGVSMIAAPAFIIAEALSTLWSGFSVGVVEYIFQGVLLIVLCLLIRKFKWKYLLAFLVAVIYGYTLDLFLFIFSSVEFNHVALRYVMLIVGDICVSFGVACFFRTYLPLQVYELFVAESSSAFNININKVKYVFDGVLLIVSLVLAFTLFGDVKTFDFTTIWYSSYHSIGLGTIITTIINSPIIALMGKFIDKVFVNEPLFPKLKTILG